jgi:hypothetical protein
MTGQTTHFLVHGGRGRAVARCALALVAVAGVLAGCATSPPQAESMRDPQADFAAYRTFGWTSGATLDGTDAPLKLLDSNLRAAIAAELQRRGYTAAATGTVPDLRITYETASEQKLESNPVRVGIGVGSWGGNIGGSVNVGSPSVRNYQEGTLVVHAIDTARNAEVWQGRVSKKITKGSTEPAAVAQAVAIVMKDFPGK